jgi:anion-transporting  ArsA/GET3 family ATPase
MKLPRLVFVTGKGGTGKSTTAAALATMLARRNFTTVADLDQRYSAARILGADLNGANRVSITERLEARALSPRKELELFIERIVPIKAVSRRMLRSQTFGYVTAALPGLEAFLLLERLRMLAGEAAREDHYVVIDGPATGTSLELLSVADGVKRIAPAGTLNRLAEQLEEFVRDENRFGVVITLGPEELALREALQAADELRRLRIAVAGTVLNGTTKALFTRAEVKRIKQIKPEYAELAQRRVEIAQAAERARSGIKEAGLYKLELPLMFKTALERSEIQELSRIIEAQLEW